MVQLRIWVKNMESKKEIRERILKARNAMPKNAWEAKSKIIYEYYNSEVNEIKYLTYMVISLMFMTVYMI